MIARLKPGVTPRRRRPAMQVLFSQLGQAQPDVLSVGRQIEIELLPAGKGLSQLRAQYERPLLALTALVTLVLLITCTNVGNLLMVRNAARRRELTVRVALGARPLATDPPVPRREHAARGHGLASWRWSVARWGVSIILSMLPLPAIPEGLAFHADARILGFAAGVSLLSALLFGLAPAWRATQVDLTAALQIEPGRARRRRAPAARPRCSWPARSDCPCSCWSAPDCSCRRCGTCRTWTSASIPKACCRSRSTRAAAATGEGQVGAVYRLLLERVAAIPGCPLGHRHPQSA